MAARRLHVAALLLPLSLVTFVACGGGEGAQPPFSMGLGDPKSAGQETSAGGFGGPGNSAPGPSFGMPSTGAHVDAGEPSEGGKADSGADTTPIEGADALPDGLPDFGLPPA